jgi:SAM-dependent methyltransferase
MTTLTPPLSLRANQENAAHGEYVLATGAEAVRRLHILHNIYSRVGRRVLRQAGLTPGMHVADFGCGAGAVTRMLADRVGPTGSVTGIDANGAQLGQADAICRSEGLANVRFVEADACCTGLPRESFDLVYCRFLLLHLPDPAACLREMRGLLRPGGIIVVEDGDLASAGSLPPTALNAFGELFARLAPSRGVNYSLSRNLYHLVKAAGFPNLDIEIHQPAITRGEDRFLLKWSVEEAGPALLAAGILTRSALKRTLHEMQAAIENPDVVVLGPLMSLVWGRKPA